MKKKTLEEFKEVHYGKRGTKKRDKLENGYKMVLLEEYNILMDKIIAKDIPIYEKLIEMIEEASKYKVIIKKKKGFKNGKV